MDAEAERQWALVAEIRRELARDDDKAPWPGLESDWQGLDIAHNPYLPRDDDTLLAGYVLPSIESWLEEFDTYPPPEMLLALCELFRRYMNAAGALTLEEAFFGKPVQRQGSYAARSAKRDPQSGIGFALAFHGGKHKGMSDARAASYAQQEVEHRGGRTLDADTMLRRMRRKRTRTK
ncbi:MAG TPA: hypothetical protein VF021_01345 [Longimicrobiales bacterium]|jgi:hypothetical protein